MTEENSLHAVFDSLAVTANRIADERNEFKAQRDALLTAAKAYFDERDAPVRDTAMLELRRHELREAISDCEKEQP